MEKYIAGKYTIRNAEKKDKERILEIYAYARKFMAENGNPDQWKNNNPSEEVIDADITGQHLYVIEDNSCDDVSERIIEGVKDGSRIHGVFYFRIGKDDTYSVIEDGQWLSDEEYGTIHRIAGDGTLHGVLSMAVEFADSKISHLRIDTHNDNKIMQHVIVKNGFKRCGIIHVRDGSARIAYEKTDNLI